MPKKTKHDITLRSFDESLPMLFLRARESLTAPFRAVINQNGLTEPQWRVIRALVQFGELDTNTLSERCYLMQPSVSRITKRLETDGMIVRFKDSHDARRTMVAITEAGLERVRYLAPRIEKIYQELENRIGRDRIEQYYEMLRNT